MESRTIWVISETDPCRVRSIRMALGLHEPVAKALVNRGVKTAEEARKFLDPHLSDLHDPYLFVDMKAAVSRIADAIRRQEQIVVYGDYDVDGITATAILVKFLRRLGGSVTAYIPDRQQGYGLNCDAIRLLASQGCKLVVTADCGISSYDEVALGSSLGIDFIVTDHHEPPARLPRAVAILNPKVPGSGYPFSGLAGVGVAFKLVQAIVRVASRKPDISCYLKDYIDLAALGTIADMVPMIDENRVIVRIGLPIVASGRNHGLAALCKVAGLPANEISVRDVLFALSPRINAAGRMGSPYLALNLLLTEDGRDAYERALEMDRLNTSRKSVQQEILEDILFSLPAPADYEDAIVITIGENWHPGVVGLVASKITEMYYRPAVVLSLESGQARGSARSIPGFDMYAALCQCSDLLSEFGGHQQAAGLTVQESKIEELTDRLRCIARESLNLQSLVRRVHIDSVLTSSELNIDLARQVQLLEPFGESNPPPLFLVPRIPVLEYRTVGAESRHLKLTLGGLDSQVDAIAFGRGDFAMQILSNHIRTVDIVGEITIDAWNGRERLQMVVHDIASAGSAVLEGDSDTDQ